MAQFRFYAELNDFLAPWRRWRDSACECAPHASVKHMVEALGVPHTEVGLVLCNGQPCSLAHRPLADGDRLSVYPPMPRLQVPAAGDASPRLAADAHLGRLARHLRFAGYDTLWHEHGSDAELAALARDQGRIVLTRDRALLMHRDVVRGCYLRPTEPWDQMAELARRLPLDLRARRPARCLVCNAMPVEVDRQAVLAELPPRTRQSFDRFWRCPGCARVFWRGSHWQRMHAQLQALAEALPAPSPYSPG